MISEQPERTFTINPSILNTLRLQCGLSWATLGRQAEIDESTLRRWRKGGEAYLSKIESVAKVLKCSPQTLIDGEKYGWGNECDPRQSYERFARVVYALEKASNENLPMLRTENVLIAIREAASQTRAYTKSMQQTKQRDRRVEIEIAILWHNVVGTLYKLYQSYQKMAYASDIQRHAIPRQKMEELLQCGEIYTAIERVALKVKYWTRIDAWTEAQIDAAGIRLEPLERQVEELIKRISKDQATSGR